MSDGPNILVSLPRELVDQLAPGAIRDAEIRSQGFEDPDRWRWIAGHIGAHLEAVLR